MSTLAHHGVTFVPLGYAKAFAQLTNLSEVHGGKCWHTIIVMQRHGRSPLYRTGSPWGAGTFAGSDGSRQPSALELEIATIQGKAFYEQVKKVKF